MTNNFLPELVDVIRGECMVGPNANSALIPLPHLAQRTLQARQQALGSETENERVVYDLLVVESFLSLNKGQVLQTHHHAHYRSLYRSTLLSSDRRNAEYRVCVTTNALHMIFLYKHTN